MCVTVVGFALKHDACLVPTTARHVARFIATNHLSEVLLTAEQDFDIFVQTATTIETSINNDTIAMVVLTQDVRVDATETRVTH